MLRACFLAHGFVLNAKHQHRESRPRQISPLRIGVVRVLLLTSSPTLSAVRVTLSPRNFSNNIVDQSKLPNSTLSENRTVVEKGPDVTWCEWDTSGGQPKNEAFLSNKALYYQPRITKVLSNCVPCYSWFSGGVRSSLVAEMHHRWLLEFLFFFRTSPLLLSVKSLFRLSCCSSAHRSSLLPDHILYGFGHEWKNCSIL